MGITVLLLAVCLLPSGIVSLRRGAWQATEAVAAYRADDLACYAGIQKRLRTLPAGAVLLADPVTAYGLQSLAPTYVVADFKVWNGTTDTGRVRQRIELLRDAFDTASPAAAVAAVDELVDRYGARYLVVAAGEVAPPLSSDLGTFDAVGLRRALADGRIGASLLAAGTGRGDDAGRAECDLRLYDLRGSTAWHPQD